MKVRIFISASAALLCLWLTATYVRVVPMETYYGQTALPDEAPAVAEGTTPPARPDLVIASH